MEKLDPEAKSIMQRWQYLKGRDCLLDSFTSLRAAIAAAPTEWELALVIKILFYEQSLFLKKLDQTLFSALKKNITLC